jgi:hypothetical protein
MDCRLPPAPWAECSGIPVAHVTVHPVPIPVRMTTSSGRSDQPDRCTAIGQRRVGRAARSKANGDIIPGCQGLLRAFANQVALNLGRQGTGHHQNLRSKGAVMSRYGAGRVTPGCGRYCVALSTRQLTPVAHPGYPALVAAGPAAVGYAFGGWLAPLRAGRGPPRKVRPYQAERAVPLSKTCIVLGL